MSWRSQGAGGMAPQSSTEWIFTGGGLALLGRRACFIQKSDTVVCIRSVLWASNVATTKKSCQLFFRKKCTLGPSVPPMSCLYAPSFVHANISYRRCSNKITGALSKAYICVPVSSAPKAKSCPMYDLRGRVRRLHITGRLSGSR